MKDKIMVFIIGLLLGAILATGAFYLFVNNSNDCNQSSQMTGGQPPEMPDGQTPPEKPDGENGQPPEMPSNNTQNSN